MTGDVFLLVFDSLRRDSVEPYSDTTPTPGISKLASDGFVLEQAYSTGSWTVPAHGSLFTGEYPSIHNATGDTKKLPSSHQTLAEKASEEGFKPIAISANPWISPDFGFDRGFGSQSEYLHDSLPFPDVADPREANPEDTGFLQGIGNVLSWAYEEDAPKRLAKLAYFHLLFEFKPPESGEVTDQLLSKLEYLSDGDQTFCFANYMDPHEPYFDDRNSKTSWNLYSVNNPCGIDSSEIRAAYSTSVSLLDQGVFELIRGLKNQGRYDDALIVAVSDHGQSLGEHGYWGHGTYLYDELLHVPAIIKPPGGNDSMTPVSRLTSLRDIYNLVVDGFEEDLSVEDWVHYATNDVVLAESAGPHMNVTLDDGRVSKRGYWKFYGESWSAEKHLDSGEITVSRGSKAPSGSTIRNKIDQISEKEDLSVGGFGASDTDVDADVEQRLEHLGYN